MLESGVGALTIDGVAARAGLSKGGVLYNYRSKDALVAGLIDHLCDRWSNEINERTKKYQARGLNYPTLRAVLSLEHDVLERVLPVCLISMSDRRAEHISPFRDLCKKYSDRISSEIANPAAAVLAEVFIDGLYSRRAFDVELRKPEELEAAKELLFELLDRC